jgi:hypothetical protein
MSVHLCTCVWRAHVPVLVASGLTKRQVASVAATVAMQ